MTTFLCSLFTVAAEAYAISYKTDKFASLQEAALTVSRFLIQKSELHVNPTTGITCFIDSCFTCVSLLSFLRLNHQRRKNGKRHNHQRLS